MDQPGSLAALLDHVQDKVVVVDRNGTITYANAATERMLGYDPETIVGTDAFEYIHPDDVDSVAAAFARVVDDEADAESTKTFRFAASDGEWLWLESRVSNVDEADFEGYVVSSRDVTDRVRAEERRDETNTRLTELAGTTGDVLWMFSADWSELLFLNHAFEDVYGLSVDELDGNPAAFIEAVHPDDVDRVLEAMDRIAEGESVDMEYRVNPGEDYGVWVWVQAEPIVEDGEVVRITGFSRDVTDRRRREQQLYVMDNLLRHNLRNDLTLILGNAQLIENEHPEATERTSVIRETGEELLESAEKEREIIDLLTNDGACGTVDVSELVAEAVSIVEGRFPNAVIEVDCEPSATATAVEGLELAFVELLENAVQHSESDTASLSVEVRTVDDEVHVVVRDDAPQIPEMESKVLTGNYEMNDVYHSSGLGLWLVHWAVELSGGLIAVTSNEGDRNAGDGNVVEIVLGRSRQSIED